MKRIRILERVDLRTEIIAVNKIVVCAGRFAFWFIRRKPLGLYWGSGRILREEPSRDCQRNCGQFEEVH